MLLDLERGAKTHKSGCPILLKFIFFLNFRIRLKINDSDDLKNIKSKISPKNKLQKIGQPGFLLFFLIL